MIDRHSLFSNCIWFCWFYCGICGWTLSSCFQCDRLEHGSFQRSPCTSDYSFSANESLVWPEYNKLTDERMHVQYTFQLDLEVNSKQIERRLFRLPFHILYLIILLICLNLFDLSMKSILFSGIYERIISFDSIALQPYVHVYSIYLYK